MDFIEKLVYDKFQTTSSETKIDEPDELQMVYFQEEAKSVLNWEKCHFMVTNNIVLGHIVSLKGIGVDKSRIELIANLPTPKSVKDVRSFLGHAGFYRRFI